MKFFLEIDKKFCNWHNSRTILHTLLFSALLSTPKNSSFYYLANSNGNYMETEMMEKNGESAKRKILVDFRLKFP